MRLDKYLKISRIIRRRTVANEACAGGRVSVNGRIAKPGADVKPGDILTIRFGEHVGVYEVISVVENVRKDQADQLYRVIEEDAGAVKERE
jgi:ribosomal 50S subunit-recycling heat shock protein